MSVPNEQWFAPRPSAPGKFLYVGDQKLWVKGVTYGTFRPGPDGTLFPAPAVVRADFAQIAAAGFNTVRTYTAPPPWLLDVAADHGLSVMAGFWWPQHVTFLDDRRRPRAIERTLRATVRQYADHPALLAVAIGNEIPASIVRWHGAAAIERHLRHLHDAAKDADPGALVTYVNYPTTEYLELPFLDFVCFNVYLEAPERLAAYLARLHNIAGDRPLIMGEIGLDSLRHGEAAQAQNLQRQLAAVYAGGVAGAFVFSWTDEWYCGGVDIEDWAFGLTRHDRSPKPALGAVRDAVAELPCSKEAEWPTISVVVCSYNGARTIRDTLTWLGRLEYPSYEVIVVNDGSTDATPHIAREFGVRLISTPNRGLSHARNLGLTAATGEIVAYIDDDAYPDPHWLTYLALAFMGSDHAGVGGPNIPPPGDGPIAVCVAKHRGGRSTSCSRTTSPSTSPAATWPSAGSGCRPSAASIRSSGGRATTSTSAGGCRRPDGRWASAPPRWSGITAGTRSGPTCASRSVTATPRRCSSASGRRSTTRPAMCRGRAVSTARASRERSATERGSITARGAARPSSPSTGRRIPRSPAWSSCPSGISAPWPWPSSRCSARSGAPCSRRRRSAR